MLALLLAQLTKDNSSSFLIVVAGGSLSIFLINQVLTFYKSHMKEQPAPAQTYATKQELARVETATNEELARVETATKDNLTRVETDLKTSMGKLTDALSREVSAQAGKRKAIYEDIEQLGKDMAALKADSTTQSRHLFSIEQKVDRLIERTPRS